eukprot:257299_1
MLATYINKIELKHWISLFLTAPFRDFMEYRFLNGVKPKKKPIITTNAMYAAVVKKVKRDIVNVLVMDKYCHWKGLKHSGNEAKLSTPRHNDNNNTHTRSARAKSTVSNLLHLRRRRRSSVSTIHLDSLNISDHSPPIPQRKLSLKECLTTEFIDQCKETAEEEVAYYLSIDFDVYHEDKIEQLLSNPLLAFETAPLVTKCPILSCRIAPYYLVDHDSESSSEAQFSDAGFTASDIRSLLKPETLRSLQLERMQYLRKEKMKPKSI